MFYIALFFLILLVIAALVLLIQNVAILLSSVHLTFFSWHLPGIPVFLLFLLGAILGGLLLYTFSLRSTRHDARKIKRLNARIKELRAQIEEREKSQMRLPSGARPTNFAPPAGPMRFFSPSGILGSSGPFGQREVGQLPQAAQPPQSRHAWPKWRQDSGWLR